MVNTINIYAIYTQLTGYIKFLLSIYMLALILENLQNEL